MLDDVKHVEAVALLRRIVDEVGDQIPFRAVVEGWLAENHPPPEAYMASMRHLAGETESPG